MEIRIRRKRDEKRPRTGHNWEPVPLRLPLYPPELPRPEEEAQEKPGGDDRRVIVIDL